MGGLTNVPEVSHESVVYHVSYQRFYAGLPGLSMQISAAVDGHYGTGRQTKNGASCGAPFVWFYHARQET
jgi:hypothetical protein